MPIASMAEDMVFAVNIPPHEPDAGARVALDFQQFGLVDSSGAELPDGFERAEDGRDRGRPGGPA